MDKKWSWYLFFGHFANVLFVVLTIFLSWIFLSLLFPEQTVLNIISVIGTFGGIWFGWWSGRQQVNIEEQSRLRDTCTIVSVTNGVHVGQNYFYYLSVVVQNRSLYRVSEIKKIYLQRNGGESILELHPTSEYSILPSLLFPGMKKEYQLQVPTNNAMGWMVARDFLSKPIVLAVDNSSKETITIFDKPVVRQRAKWLLADIKKYEEAHPEILESGAFVDNTI